MYMYMFPNGKKKYQKSNFLNTTSGMCAHPKEGCMKHFTFAKRYVLIREIFGKFIKIIIPQLLK